MSKQPQLEGLNEPVFEVDFYMEQKTDAFDAQHLIRKTPVQPRVWAKPRMKFVRDQDVESFETLSIQSGGSGGKKDKKDDKDKDKPQPPQPLEYRITGLTWYTPRFVNTCNIDSFLSAWVRKMRQSHGRYLKHVNIIDKAGSALYEIADHALCTKEKVDSTWVKGLWLLAILKETNEVDRMRRAPLDCAGCNIYSVFQHLQNHSMIEIVSKCKCGTFYHYDYILDVPNLKQIEILGTPRNLNDAIMPKCLRCNEPRILLDLIPQFKTNWMVAFYHNGSKKSKNKSPLLSDIPQIIQIADILFKLEYITYVQKVGSNQYHEVSLQYIRQQWYLYDGTKSPKFRRYGGARFTTLDAKLNTLVYFKI
jgi:hypothetical protein